MKIHYNNLEEEESNTIRIHNATSNNQTEDDSFQDNSEEARDMNELDSSIDANQNFEEDEQIIKNDEEGIKIAIHAQNNDNSNNDASSTPFNPNAIPQESIDAVMQNYNNPIDEIQKKGPSDSFAESDSVSTLDAVKKATTDVSSDLVSDDGGELELGKKDETAINSAKGGATAVVGVLSFAQNCSKLYNEKDSWKRLELTGSILKNSAEATEGVLNVLKEDKTTKKTEMRADIAGIVTSTLSSIENTYSSVKGFYDAYKSSNETESYEKSAKASEDLLKAIQGGAETAKKAMEVMNSNIPPGLADFIPGISIAVQVVDLFIKMYDYYSNNKNEEKVEEMGNVASNSLRDALGMNDNDYKAKVNRQYKSGGIGFFGNKYTRPKKEIMDAAVLFRNAPPQNDNELKEMLEDENYAALKPLLADKSLSKSQTIIELLFEFELASKEVELNHKRKKSAAEDIFINFVGIAADVATLSGAGAMVGAGLKASIAAGKGLKALGNYVRKKTADDEHSDAGKLKKAAQHSRTIMGMYQKTFNLYNEEKKVNDVTIHKGGSSEEMLKKARAYVSSAGMGYGAFESQDPKKSVEDLTKKLTHK